MELEQLRAINELHRKEIDLLSKNYQERIDKLNEEIEFLRADNDYLTKDRQSLIRTLKIFVAKDGE